MGVLAVAAVAVVALLAGMFGAGFGAFGAPRASGSLVANIGGTPTSSARPSQASDAPAASVSFNPDGFATPGPSTSPSNTPSSSPSIDPAAVQAALLRAKLDQLRKQFSIPGVSVAILWDDGRSWLGASGMADVVGKVPVTPDSGFALASISKTFTAAIVLQLVGERRLTLDESVAARLPAYRLDRRITVRMLLDHTSGLPDFFLNRTIDKALQGAPDVAWTPARVWAYVAKKRPIPGSVWLYSNTNYLLLGELVKAVTGRPLATEIRGRLLDPLGLTATWYQAVEKPKAKVTFGYRLVAKSGGGARPVRVAPASNVMPFRSVVTAAGGAGSIAATALDAARWMQAFAGGRVLSPAMQQAMLEDVQVATALHAKIPYGLGIEVTTLAGRLALGHSGRYLGFRNAVRYLPAEGVTIAVLTNQNTADPAKLASALLGIVLPPLPTPMPSGAPSASPAGTAKP
jgi:D-alanyl-D-alanine carboxypeptidase